MVNAPDLVLLDHPTFAERTEIRIVHYLDTSEPTLKNTRSRLCKLRASTSAHERPPHWQLPFVFLQSNDEEIVRELRRWVR